METVLEKRIINEEVTTGRCPQLISHNLISSSVGAGYICCIPWMVKY